MRLLLLGVALLYGCSSTATSSRPPGKSIGDLYQEAFQQHFASVEKWLKGNDEWLKCYKLADSDRKAVQPCLDALPAPETYLPKDLKKDEILSEYLARKRDEWDEKDCFYKGLMQARYIGESQRIQDQCLQTLETKRLLKAIERQRKE